MAEKIADEIKVLKERVNRLYQWLWVIGTVGIVLAGFGIKLQMDLGAAKHAAEEVKRSSVSILADIKQAGSEQILSIQKNSLSAMQSISKSIEDEAKRKVASESSTLRKSVGQENCSELVLNKNANPITASSSGFTFSEVRCPKGKFLAGVRIINQANTDGLQADRAVCCSLW